MRFPGHHAACFKRTLLHDNRADIWMNDGNLGAPKTFAEKHASTAGLAVAFPQGEGNAGAGHSLEAAWKWRQLSDEALRTNRRDHSKAYVVRITLTVKAYPVRI